MEQALVPEHLDREDISAEEIHVILEKWFGSTNQTIEDTPRQPLPLPSLKTEMEGISTGFPDLDAIIRGLKPGQIVSIVNDPSGGASTFALNLVRKALRGIPDKNGEKIYPQIAVCSPQQPRSVFVQRLFCSLARVEPHRFMLRQLLEPEKERLRWARELLQERPEPCILDTYGANLEEFRRTVTSLKNERGIDLLIVDQAEVIGLHPDGSAGSLLRTLEVLKEMALSLKLPVIAMTRYEKKRRPSRSELPETTHVYPPVALMSDVLILMHRTDYWDTMNSEDEELPDKGLEIVTAEVAYNRSGARGMIPLVFDPRHARFDSVRWDM